MQAALTFVLLVGLKSHADDIISPLEARKRVNHTVIVEMVVQATKNRLEKRGEIYLDSQADFHDPRNLGIVITKVGAAKFKKRKVDDPAEHFKGKTIRVKGIVTLKDNLPRIEVNDPEQIHILGRNHEPRQPAP